ncbi:MAG: hypothetical protein ACOX55_06540 [Christensenellales bacterium]
MNLRERVNAILHGRPYTGGVPVISFGYWVETLDLWAQQGHVTQEEAQGYRREGDNSQADRSVMNKLGFDFNWNRCVGGRSYLYPSFQPETLRTEPDGARIIRNSEGLIVRVHDGIVSIPAEIGTSMTGREAWEEMYLPRLTYSKDRVDHDMLARLKAEDATRTEPLGLHAGSLYGNIRNMLGVEGISFLQVDDEDLYREVIDTVGNLCFEVARDVAASGIRFDYGHFWEDICFKTGPLVNPRVFEELVGPHYRRITTMLNEHGIDIISLDCDGCIDLLVPIWLKNGVNTMFPIEVGTWNASIAPWRAQYGEELRGVGGMDKRVFAHDKAAIDAEIERLKPLVALGRYLPCPDHRIPPDAKFELVQYYCDRFRATFA